MFQNGSLQLCIQEGNDKALIYLQKLCTAAWKGKLKDLKRCIQKGANLEYIDEVSKITEIVSMKILFYT